MSLALTLKVRLDAAYTRALDLTEVSAPLAYEQRPKLTDGNGASQASKLFSDTITIAGEGSQDLDLYDLAGALDALGETFALSKIKGILIRNKATAADAIVSIGGKGTSAAWVSPFGDEYDIIKLHPGGIFLLFNPTAAGYAVVDATNHLLTLANAGAAAADVEVIVIAA